MCGIAGIIGIKKKGRGAGQNRFDAEIIGASRTE